MAKKRKSEEPAAPVPALFDRVLRRVVLAGIYGGLLAPVLALEDSTAYPFVFFKTLVLQAVIALSVPAFLLLLWRQPALRPRRSWISVALGGYFLALSPSCVFAFHRHLAFWGSQERMGGLFSLAHLFVWYVMATSLLRSWPDWRRILHWQAALGFFAALSALFDLGNPAVERIAGVLGNPIYCATYQVFIIGILALLWVRTGRRALRALYAFGAVASLITLFFTGSRGPFLGLFAGMMVAVVGWTIAGRRWRFLLAGVGGLLLMAGGYVAIVLLGPSWINRPGFGRLFLWESDLARHSLWSVAVSGFRDHPLFGWGLGNYEAIFDTHYPPHMFCKMPIDSMPDTAHSLLYEHLGTTGLVGTLAFAAVWAACAVSLWRALRRGWLESQAFCVLVGLCAAYLVQGQFMTDSPGSYAMVFLLLATSCAAGFPEFACKNAPAVPPLAARPARLAPWALVALQAGGVLLAWHGSLLPGLASHVNLQWSDAFRRGGCSAMLENARRAAAMATPWPEDQVTELASGLRDLAERGSLQSCSQWRELHDLARQQAVAAYAGQPEHLRIRGTWAGLSLVLGLASRDPTLLDEAEQLHQALIAGSPQRQLYRFHYARLLAETGRVEASDAELAQALAAAPEIGESQWRLGISRWFHKKQSQLGSKMIIESVGGTCRHWLASAMDASVLAQAFSAQGDLVGLRSMEQRMHEVPPGDPQLTSAYLDIARYQERAGLLTERDQMLRLASAREPRVKAHLAPLLDGRVKNMAEAERLARPTVPSP